MGVALRRKGCDESRPPAAAGAATTLGIVGWSRWNVSHINGVEVADVNAQLHRWGAEECWQFAVSELLLSFHSSIRVYLASVLTAQHSAESSSTLFVESREVGVRLRLFDFLS